MSRARTRAMVPAPILPKMEVTAVNDPSEIEADQVADQVVADIRSGAVAAAMAARSTDGLARAEDEDALQGKRVGRTEDEDALQGARLARAEDEDALQGKRVGRTEDEDALQGARLARAEDEDALQGKRVGRTEDEDALQGARLARAAALGPEGGTLDHDLEAEVDAAAGGGQKLPEDVRGQMEAGFGADFSGVNVHLNSPLAPKLGALAFARGTDVHFAPGRFDPASATGQHLIAHELTHVVQQGGAPARTASRAARIARRPA